MHFPVTMMHFERARTAHHGLSPLVAAAPARRVAAICGRPGTSMSRGHVEHLSRYAFDLLDEHVVRAFCRARL